MAGFRRAAIFVAAIAVFLGSSGVASARILQSDKIIDFGNVAYGSTPTMSFTITNDSKRDITLGAAVFPPANFGYSPPASTCDDLGGVLAAHASCYWGLVFIAPITPGTYTGVFKQPTSQRDAKVTLTGTSTGP